MPDMSKRIFAAMVLLQAWTLAAAQAETLFLKTGDRVIFLGDSITYAGHYIALLETYLRVEQPQLHVELINVGLPSETASGLSEPDHPFPRPNIHERLDRVLTMTHPDVVVACYGINDGIYYPFDQQRFESYQKGMNKLIRKIHDHGARLVLLTPPAFDPLPMRRDGRLRPLGAEKYAWFGIYEDYDDVMTRYAEWVMRQKDKVAMVIDIHKPINAFLKRKRRDQPQYAMSSDGVHFNQQGHRILARQILSAWGFTEPRSFDDKVLALVEQREQLLRDAWLSHIGHKRPGMRTGLALAEARKQAATLDEKITQAITSSRP